jgi:predicted PurR-regulated permease PerM
LHRAPRPEVDLHIPVQSYFLFFAVAALAYASWKLTPLILLFLPAILLAATVEPLLVWMKRKGLPRGIGVLCVAILTATVSAIFIAIVLPPLINQITVLFQKLPEIARTLTHHFPEGSRFRAFSHKAASQIKIPDASSWLSRSLVAGEAAVGGLAGAVLIVVFTLYLLMDGAGTYLWLTAFLSEEHRKKLNQTTEEVAPIVSAYVTGQLITSAVCSAYTFLVLAALGVPAALALSLLAGICDVLPVIGLFISLIPSLLLALSVSPSKALLVLLAYLLYHAIENYLLVPRVYGSRLRLSDLVVIVSLLIGGTVAGLIGAIIVLPIVASYPIIERIWLVELLGRSVVRKHASTE